MRQSNPSPQPTEVERVKAAWSRPELRRMSAGSAENDIGLANDALATQS